MKKLLYCAAGAALIFSACQKENNVSEKILNIQASFEETTQTKATIDDNGVFGWVKGDVIGIYNGSGFNKLTAQSSGKSVNFYGTVLGDPQTCAVYPYASCDGTGSVKLPATYEWVENQVNTPMYAEYDPDGLSFKHLGGLFKVHIVNVPATAAEMVLKTNKDITGTYEIISGEIKSAGKAENNSVAFTFTAGKSSDMTFFVPVPVGRYVLSLSLNDASGNCLWSFDGSSANEITRGKLLIMPKLTIMNIPGSGEGATGKLTVEKTTTGTVTLPKNADKVEVTVESGRTATEPVVIAYSEESGASKASEVIIKADNAEVETLTISLPESHVELDGVKVKNLTASTSENTLVIGSEAEVESLDIQKGKVEIKGNVGSITKADGCTVNWFVGDQSSFNEAYNKGADVLTLTADITDFDKVILLGRTVTIDGKGHRIENTANRVVRLTAPNMDITFRNVSLISKCAAASDVRCISFDEVTSKVNLLVENSNLSASFYCINLIPGAKDNVITVRNASVAAGWAAINSYSNNSTFNIENSDLVGLNDKSEDAYGWHNFATIVFDGNSLNNANGAGKYGSYNTVNISGSTVYASSENSNIQRWFTQQYGAKGTIVKVDKVSQIIDNKGIDQTNNFKINNVYNVNKNLTVYEPECEIWIGDKQIITANDYNAVPAE